MLGERKIEKLKSNSSVRIENGVVEYHFPIHLYYFFSDYKSTACPCEDLKTLRTQRKQNPLNPAYQVQPL